MKIEKNRDWKRNQNPVFLMLSLLYKCLLGWYNHSIDINCFAVCEIGIRSL